MKRLVLAAGLAVALGAAACSGSTAGSGEPVGINRQSTSASESDTSTSVSAPVPATSATAATVAPPTAAPPTMAPPTIAPTTSAPPTMPAPSSVAPSPTSTVPAQISSLAATSACGGKTTGLANGSITVTWTTLGAVEVWIKAGSVAVGLIGSNPRTDGGTGPLPANGTTTLSSAFKCGDDTNYVIAQAYKGDGSGSAGQLTAISRG